MTTIEDALTRLRARGPGIDALLRRHDVRSLVLFGSARRDPATAKDLDLAVDHDGDLDQLAFVRALADELRCGEIDLLDLTTAGPVAAMEALRDPEVIFERDDANLAELVAVTVSRFADTAHLRELRRASLAS